MKANKTIMAMVFLMVSVSAISSRPSGNRLFYVENRTSSHITITTEMAPSEYDGPFDVWWGRPLIDEHGEEMWMYVFRLGPWREHPHRLQLPPGTRRILFEEYRESSLLMSPLDKLRLLYASFIVTDEQGNVLKTLDTLAEDDFIYVGTEIRKLLIQ